MSFSRKKIIGVSILIVSVIGIVFLLNYYFTWTSTSGIVTVIEKGYSEEKDEAWILVVPPNTSDELQNEFKTQIMIKERMVWNLIEEGQTYSVDYKSWHGENTLSYISHVMEENAIPR